MVKYLYDLSRLMPGDIILMRIPGDEISERVMAATQSEFSHAMLYVGDSSYIEASKRVVARNPARLLFDSKDDTCVLRIKNEYYNIDTIEKAIVYVREVVGNPYAYADALRMEVGRTDKYSEDMQICTRLVTKAFAKSGINLVENIEMCTPRQLQQSEYVDVHRDYLKIASDFDLRFAASYDVTDDMINAIFKLFDSLQSFGNGKIRTMERLIKHVIEHQEDDRAIAKLLKESGYLDVLKTEEDKNRYNYDKEEFINYYGENAYEAAICSLETNWRGEYRFSQEYNLLIKEYFQCGNGSHTLIQLIALDKQIIEQHRHRERVCMAVMNDPRT